MTRHKAKTLQKKGNNPDNKRENPARSPEVPVGCSRRTREVHVGGLQKPFRRLNMLPEKQEKTYTDFFDSASNNEILKRKTTIMIQMASAMAISCYP